MITNLTRDTLVSSRVKITQNPWERMRGLLGTKSLPAGDALLITHCQSIHMFFMQFSIDVIFCDSENKVVGLCQGIKPFSLSPVFFKAFYAIELPTGTISSSKTQLGDYLIIK